MKKLTWGLVLVLLAVSAFAVFGQIRDEDPFYRSVPIVKVLSHPLGYKVYYLKINMEVGSFYAPVDWFVGVANKGAIVWGNDASFPYFTVYWNKGEFSYIKLFLVENKRHESWGVLRGSEDLIAGRFDIEEPQIDF